MVNALLGKKIGMTQVFDGSGRRIPVTVLEIGPCPVVQVKTEDTDGKPAVQIGFGDKKRKNTTSPLAGHFEKAGVAPTRLLQDVEPDGDELPEPGQELTVTEFEGTDHVDITGTSKGRGFAGVLKRHGFHGSPATHGGRFGRGSGSIGTSATPSHVQKGRRMAGHMGAAQVTVRNIEVVTIDTDRNLLLVKGSVPGPNGGFVRVRKAAQPRVSAQAQQ